MTAPLVNASPDHMGFMDPENPFRTMGEGDKFLWGAKDALKDKLRAIGQRTGLLSQEDIDRYTRNSQLAALDPTAAFGQRIGDLGFGTGLALSTGPFGRWAGARLASLPGASSVAAAPPIAGSLALASKAAGSVPGQGAILGETGALLTPHATGEDDALNQLTATAGGALTGQIAHSGRNLVSPMFGGAARKWWQAPTPQNGLPADTGAWANKGKELTGSFLPPYAYKPGGTSTGEQVLGLLPGSTNRTTIADTARQNFTNAVGKKLGLGTNAQGNVRMDIEVPPMTEEVGQKIGALRDQYGVTAKMALGPKSDAAKAINAADAHPLASVSDTGEARVRTMVKQLQGAFSDATGANGAMDGRLYTDLRTRLYDLQGDAYKANFKPGVVAAKTLRDEIDDAFRRTLTASATPEDQAAAAALNKQYSMLRTLRAGDGQEIYNTDPAQGPLGTLDPAALHKAATERGDTWITAARETPQGGESNYWRDMTNLGVSPGYTAVSKDLSGSPSAGHGLVAALGHGAPAVLPAYAAWHMMPDDMKEHDPAEAAMLSGLVGLGGYGIGRTAGALSRSPAMTQGMADAILSKGLGPKWGPRVAALPEWGGYAAERGLPFSIAPAMHDYGVTGGLPAAGAAPGAGKAPEDEVSWDVGAPTSHP